MWIKLFEGFVCGSNCFRYLYYKDLKQFNPHTKLSNNLTYIQSCVRPGVDLLGVYLSRFSMSSGYLVSRCIACGRKSFSSRRRHKGLPETSCQRASAEKHTFSLQQFLVSN